MRSLSDILVVSDMDGTLLSTRKMLSDADLAAIHLFTSLGGKFTVATGRVVESVARYTKLLPYLSPAITSGGCVVYDYNKNLMLQNWVLPSKNAVQALTEIRARFPDVGVVVMAGDSKVYTLKTSAETQILFNDEKLVYYMSPLNNLPDAWNKVLFASSPDQLRELEEFVAKRRYEGMCFVRTDKNYFEMMPSGINKATSLLSVCEIVGVTKENTIAIGDYYNDLEIMRTAGHSVAMENAPHDVRSVAKEITGKNNFSGVGQYLYKLVKEFYP